MKLNLYQNGLERNLNHLIKREREALLQAIDLLKGNPRPLHMNFEQLWSNTDVKRIKVGRMRMFYMIDSRKGQVRIGKIDNRDSGTYRNDSKSWFNISA